MSSPHGEASLKLEGVYPGARNESLFLVVRLWAYKQRRGTDLGAWVRHVKDYAIVANYRMPVPLEAREAASLAYSIATWVWCEFDELVPTTRGKAYHLDHSSLAQSWRGTFSGEARRRETPLEDDRRPWEALGVSRSTWYRRSTDGRIWTEPLNQGESSAGPRRARSGSSSEKSFRTS